jgi:hypothetical protein
VRFRKKPVIISAILCKDALKAFQADWKELPDWLAQAYGKEEIVFSNIGIQIFTLEGTMWANADDWVICGISGEIYPCKPDIFEATYEVVED